ALHAERAVAAADLDAAASALTEAREQAASALAAVVTDELHALALPEATVTISVSATADSSSGRDEVAILLAPHPGAEPRAVAR
ncbi:hypothetical protein ABTM19_20825, partial [Acinetobacter baumannii]